jgi:hypothetical protein
MFNTMYKDRFLIALLVLKSLLLHILELTKEVVGLIQAWHGSLLLELRDGARSENLGGQVVMRLAAATQGKTHFGILLPFRLTLPA